jgi:hypothetical protein
LVVTDDNHTILGIIGERDIARGLERFGRNVVDKPVRELMRFGLVGYVKKGVLAACARPCWQNGMAAESGR